MKALVDTSRNNWLQKIPTKWEIFRIKNLFQLSQEKNQGEDLPVLSLAQSGIRTRDISTNEGQLAESYENYTRIRPDDLVFNPMDLRSGAIDLSTYNGVISLAYSVLRKHSGVNIHLKYFKYYFQWHYLDEIFFPFGQGVSADHRWTLKDNILLNFPVLFPPLETQKRIADFLDKKTQVIDELVTKKEKLIELLREKRAALITRAVTKGLNPNAKLKPSRVDWLGDIPKHWVILPLGFLTDLNWGDISLTKESYTTSGFVAYSASGPDGFMDHYDYEKIGIVLSAIGAKCGQTWLACGKWSCIKNTIRFWSKREDLVSTEYLFLVTQSQGFWPRRGSAQPFIGRSDALKAKLSLPPLEEQKQIADFLDAETAKVDKAVALIESQIEKLKEYRSSLIYHAVTGKMKV